MRQTQITRINSGVLLSKFLMNLNYAFSIYSNILCQDYIQIIPYKDQHFQAHLSLKMTLMSFLMVSSQI